MKPRINASEPVCFKTKASWACAITFGTQKTTINYGPGDVGVFGEFPWHLCVAKRIIYYFCDVCFCDIFWHTRKFSMRRPFCNSILTSFYAFPIDCDSIFDAMAGSAREVEGSNSQSKLWHLSSLFWVRYGRFLLISWPFYSRINGQIRLNRRFWRYQLARKRMFCMVL